MGEIWLRCDMRTADFGISTPRLAQLHLEQAEWADKLGIQTIQLPEHHGVPDGYNPSPFVLGAALAARTESIRFNLFALLLPLHDPVRVAEDAAVLDNICNGRLDLTIGLGWVPSEFAMLGVSIKDRAKRVEAGMEVLRRSFAGEEFDFEGRPVRVRPLPATPKGPRLFVGGGVPESARRAAWLGDGFAPASSDQAKLVAIYEETCRELGKEPGPVYDLSGPQFLYVTEDPEAAWHKIAPFALHETNTYGKWADQTGTYTAFHTIKDVDALKESGLYKVVTPEEAIALGNSLFDRGMAMTINPSLCGLDEDFSWASLDLFARKVLPHLKLD